MPDLPPKMAHHDDLIELADWCENNGRACRAMAAEHGSHTTQHARLDGKATTYHRLAMKLRVSAAKLDGTMPIPVTDHLELLHFEARSKPSRPDENHPDDAHPGSW